MRVARRLIVCLMFMHSAASIADQTYRLEGLERPAEIIVDEWGVPHIYAETQYDAFFLQGFNAARDRLWQIDLWRLRGLGLLSSAFGDQFVEQDRANRLFLYRGDMYREWLAYGSDAKRIAEAFTAGINAYVELIDNNPELLPPEFELLNYRPSRWDAADVVRIRSHGLLRNLPNEVRRARIACVSNLEHAGNWRVLEPEWTTTVPDGLDPCDVPADVLKTYSLARSGVSFEPVSIASMTTPAPISGIGDGSNNWVVAPSRSATGRPVLADDPHRSHAVPSLRYIAHLVAPGMNVIGAGEPALPGISIGHNERIAFGLTIFPIDQEDLYVYERDGDRYGYREESERFASITETIPVRDAPDVDVELRFTRHGPVIYENEEHAFAVRAGWLEPGMAPYFGSVEYMRANNWREFLSALNRWGAPSENQVYADVDGNIGYKPAGLFPRRPNWDGLLPVPGDGRYEWDGFFDMDVLPVEVNPERGFTGSANSMNLPADYPIAKYPVGFEWTEPWRYDRLWEVLSQQGSHTMEDSAALQTDYQSLLAARIVGLLPKTLDSAAATMLRNWDGHLGPDSGPAALYMVWLELHLRPAIQEWLLPEDPSLFRNFDTRIILRLLAEQDVEDLVARTLDAAYADVESRLGGDSTKWKWGSIHQTDFEHPLLNRANGPIADAMRIERFPLGGSGRTTNNTRSSDNALTVDGGASYRQIIDVGNWDAARMTNTPGQSGDPRSPFYDNLLEGWANHGYFPLLYTRDSIEEHAEIKIELVPVDTGE
ncbi:MAG: penicillin acylase family protein [Pseudomonadota bacterium]